MSVQHVVLDLGNKPKVYGTNVDVYAGPPGHVVGVAGVRVTPSGSVVVTIDLDGLEPGTTGHIVKPVTAHHPDGGEQLSGVRLQSTFGPGAAVLRPGASRIPPLAPRPRTVLDG